MTVKSLADGGWRINKKYKHELFLTTLKELFNDDIIKHKKTYRDAFHYYWGVVFLASGTNILTRKERSNFIDWLYKKCTYSKTNFWGITKNIWRHYYD